jgi:hypothetical protein
VAMADASEAADMVTPRWWDRGPTAAFTSCAARHRGDKHHGYGAAFKLALIRT